MAIEWNEPVGTLPADSTIFCQEDSLVHVRGPALTVSARSCVTAHTCMQTNTSLAVGCVALQPAAIAFTRPSVATQDMPTSPQMKSSCGKWLIGGPG